MLLMRVGRALVALTVAMLGIVPVLRAGEVSAVQVSSASCFVEVSNAAGVVVTEALNGDCVVSFTAVGTTTWTRPTGVTSARVFVVAGGGGGGGHPGGDPGGGGGGGIVDVPQFQLTETTYDITVGKGGRGNNAGPCGNAWFSGEDGDPSQVGTTSLVLIKAFGGGGGAGACDVYRPGGSGGGAHCGAPGGVAIAPEIDVSIVGALTYGNAGGKSFADACNRGAGGGGGATQPGGDGTDVSGGNGGEGLAVDVLGTGTNVVYASGGGGAGASPAIAVGRGGTNAGDGFIGTSAGKSGVANTGSGGGGHLCDQATGPICAGSGGSGIVIIRYSISNAPTTTVSVTTTTVTTTTIAPPTTTAIVVEPTQKPSVSVEPLAPLGQTDIARVEKNVAKPAATPMVRETPQTTVATTIAPLVARSSKINSAPTPPTISNNSAGVVVDGIESSATITRSNNTLNVVGGGVTANISGVSLSGERISLDNDGNLRLSDGDQIVIEATGYISGEDIGVWLFSTPTQLGSLTAVATGKIAGRFALPTDIESGDHRLVLEGDNSDDVPVILGLGIAVGETESSSTMARLLITIPVAMAIIFGLVIPTTLRRRRRESALV
jgi:hypothetical protein